MNFSIGVSGEGFFNQGDGSLIDFDHISRCGPRIKRHKERFCDLDAEPVCK